MIVGATKTVLAAEDETRLLSSSELFSREQRGLA